MIFFKKNLLIGFSVITLASNLVGLQAEPIVPVEAHYRLNMNTYRVERGTFSSRRLSLQRMSENPFSFAISHDVHVYDARTGELIHTWPINTLGHVEEKFYHDTHLLLIATNTQGILDLDTGEIVRIDRPVRNIDTFRVLSDDTAIIVADHTVRSVDLRTGVTEVAPRQFTHAVMALEFTHNLSLVIPGDLIFLIYRDTDANVSRILAFDVHDLSLRWENDWFSASLMFPKVLHYDGYLYAVDFFEHNLLRIDRASGELIWGITFPNPTGDLYAHSMYFVFDEGAIYTNGPNDEVWSIDAQTGNVRWRRDTNGSLSAGITVADGVVYVGNDGGVVYAFETEDGELLWAVDTWLELDFLSRYGVDLQLGRPAVTSPVAVFGDSVVLSTWRHGIHVLDRFDGTHRRFIRLNAHTSFFYPIGEEVIFYLTNRFLGGP